MRESTKRVILAVLPLIALTAYMILGIIVWDRNPGTLLLEPDYAVLTSLLIIMSLIPFSIYEYLVYKRITCIEDEAPTLLSILEASIIGGTPITQAIEHGATSVRPCLKSVLEDIIRKTRIGQSLSEEVTKLIPRETHLLKFFTEYLALLSMGGEELFRSITRYREIVNTMISFRKSLIQIANMVTIAVALILTSLVIISGLTVEFFLAKYSSIEIPGYMSISEESVSIVMTSAIYIILFLSVLSGIAISSISGLKRQSALLKTLAIGTVLILVLYFVF